MWVWLGLPETGFRDRRDPSVDVPCAPQTMVCGRDRAGPIAHPAAQTGSPFRAGH